MNTRGGVEYPMLRLIGTEDVEDAALRRRYRRFAVWGSIRAIGRVIASIIGGATRGALAAATILTMVALSLDDPTQMSEKGGWTAITLLAALGAGVGCARGAGRVFRSADSHYSNARSALELHDQGEHVGWVMTHPLAGSELASAGSFYAPTPVERIAAELRQNGYISGDRLREIAAERERTTS